MKWSKMLALLAAAAALIHGYAAAQVDFDPTDFGSEDIERPAKLTPFSLSLHGDSIQKAKIKDGYFKGDEVRYAELEAEAGAVYYYNKRYKEGANIVLAYSNNYIEWEDNPWFNQDHFDTVSLKLGAFTNRLPRWFWQTQLTINYDTKGSYYGRYSYYDLLLWGRYTYCPHIGVHLGFLAQTGMRMDRVYPILGFDWQISKKWKLSAVFPVDMSLEYAWTKRWSVLVGIRTFDARHRISKHDTHAGYLVRYENSGAEFAIKYNNGSLFANAHAGVTFGGKYRVANQYNHHPHTFKLQSSAYAGGELTVRF